MSKPPKTLKQKYDAVIAEYLSEFQKKHDTYYEDLSDDFVNVADAYLRIDDIRFDIDNNCSAENKDTIFTWYWQQVERSDERMVNYKSWRMGAR